MFKKAILILFLSLFTVWLHFFIEPGKKLHSESESEGETNIDLVIHWEPRLLAKLGELYREQERK